MELWSLMHFLMPHLFTSHHDFKEWFSNPLTGMIEGSQEYNENIVKRLHKVRLTLSPPIFPPTISFPLSSVFPPLPLSLIASSPLFSCLLLSHFLFPPPLFSPAPHSSPFSYTTSPFILLLYPVIRSQQCGNLVVHSNHIMIAHLVVWLSIAAANFMLHRT